MTLATLNFDLDPVTSSKKRCRVAMYSHDTMGLGHIRRNLLVAQSLSASCLNAEILLINGSREAATFALPPGTDTLTLPAVHKSTDGRYQSRNLPVSLTELVRIRANTIWAALEAFDPDLMIVDNVPRGIGRELDTSLAALRNNGRTRCVLGLRDVLDEPAVIRKQWAKAANEQAITDYYDAVWVYGDPLVYDPVKEYGFPAPVAAKVRYVGYLDQSRRSDGTQRCHQCRSDAPLVPREEYVLCLLGGGQDGIKLAKTFIQSPLPTGTVGVVVAGPLMDPKQRASLHRQAAVADAPFRVLDAVNDTSCLIKQAGKVIAMGGYNTVGEILSWKKNAMVVPRVSPRREQLIRAERLRDLGLLDMLHPDDLSPRAIGDWLARHDGSIESARQRIDFNALGRLPILVREILDRQPVPICEDTGQGELLRAAQ